MGKYAYYVTKGFDWFRVQEGEPMPLDVVPFSGLYIELETMQAYFHLAKNGAQDKADNLIRRVIHEELIENYTPIAGPFKTIRAVEAEVKRLKAERDAEFYKKRAHGAQEYSKR